MATLTEKETQIFSMLVASASDWGGSPVWNEDGQATKADNGALTSLKKKGLVRTTQDEVYDLGQAGRRKGSFKKNTVQYVGFTKEGLELAKQMHPENTFALQEIERAIV